jgi:hypothetical protein
VKPEWKTLDLIEHTEERIHKIVRLRHTGARPPYLTTERRGPREIVIHYSSARRMCALAKGIARGIARSYNESITIADVRCMHRGDPTCEIVVTAAA